MEAKECVDEEVPFYHFVFNLSAEIQHLLPPQFGRHLVEHEGDFHDVVPVVIHPHVEGEIPFARTELAGVSPFDDGPDSCELVLCHHLAPP